MTLELEAKHEPREQLVLEEQEEPKDMAAVYALVNRHSPPY